MKSLFADFDKIRAILMSRFVFLFLDYDGTLAPIAERPCMAFLPEKTKVLLEALSKDPFCRLAVISGREIEDVKDKVGLKGVIYAGNHGLEIQGPNIRFKFIPPLRYNLAFKKIKADLKKKLSDINGIYVEDKGLSLSVHYRLVDPKLESVIKTIFFETTAHYKAEGSVRVSNGKKVLEIRPPLEWDKGKVVLWLLGRQKVLLNRMSCVPVYIGDDLTDEDAFKALKGKGITVFAGKPKKSFAEYYVKGSKEVADFLSFLLSIKKDSM